MDSGVIAIAVAAIAAVPGIGAWQASKRANASNDRKVDLEEFRDQAGRYQQIIAEQDRHNDRMRAQLDRLNLQLDAIQQQLAKEEDVSNALRDQVRALRGQITTLEQLLEERAAIRAASLAHTPPPSPTC